MALRVISHDPPIHEVNVPINKQIRMTFSEGIIPNSVDYTTFSVNDAGTYTSVPGTLGVEYDASGISNTIIFTPTFNMTINNTYNVYAYGRPNSVLGADNRQLEETYPFSFTTGTGVLSYIGAPALPSGAAGSSGDAGQSTAITSGTYRVTSTSPQHTEPNVETQLSNIAISFNGNITSSLAELSGYVTLEETPVLQ